MATKNYLLLALATITVIPAIAQTPSSYLVPVIGNRSDRSALLHSILKEQFDASMPASKTTAVTQRLIATSGYQLGFYYDSTRYHYSTQARGASHNPKNPESYHMSFQLYYQGNPSVNGQPGGRTFYIFPDSIRRFSTQSPGGVTRFSYTASQQVATVEIDQSVPAEKWELTYDAIGNNVRRKRFVDVAPNPYTMPPTYAPFSEEHSFYNAQQRVTLDSTTTLQNGVFAPFRKTRWTYDAVGRVTSQLTETYVASSMTWEQSFRTLTTYLANGLLQKLIHETWDGSAWYTAEVDSVGYAGNNPSYTYEGYSFYVPDSARLVPVYYLTANLNAAGNWDTIRYYDYDFNSAAFKHEYRHVIDYNSYQNRSRVSTFSDPDGDGTFQPLPNWVNNYFYELYDPTSIHDVSQRGNLILAPNPTKSVLNIAWSESSTPTRYTLTDATGRILSTAPIPATASRTELSLDAYPPGFYILTLAGTDGAVLHREKVVRQ